MFGHQNVWFNDWFWFFDCSLSSSIGSWSLPRVRHCFWVRNSDTSSCNSAVSLGRPSWTQTCSTWHQFSVLVTTRTANEFASLLVHKLMAVYLWPPPVECPGPRSSPCLVPPCADGWLEPLWIERCWSAKLRSHSCRDRTCGWDTAHQWLMIFQGWGASVWLQWMLKRQTTSLF